MRKTIRPSWPIACLAALAALLLAVACDPNGASVGGPAESDEPGIGELHNRLLERITAACDERPLSKSEGLYRVTAAVGDFAAAHGAPTPSAREVEFYLERGRKMARQALLDPSAAADAAFTGEERIWWERFTAEACVPDARSVYERHCALHGVPRAGSALDYATDIWVHSAEHWFREHADAWDGPNSAKLYDPRSRLPRFFVVIAVDGIAGAIAGASGGPVIGSIIGGLASKGADELIWGDDDEV